MSKPQNSHDASTLRELKETIKLQAHEIKSLREELQSLRTTKESSSSTPPSTTPLTAAQLYPITSFYVLAYRRVGWLSFFLLSLSLTAIIMGGYEHSLSRHIELAYFVPLLAGHGGNTGGQSVGAVLTALSTGSISLKDAPYIIIKESTIGLSTGCVLGCIIGPLAHYLFQMPIHVATVVSLTLPLLGTMAATLASIAPFACVWIGWDPSVIAAPMMTTTVDVCGLLTYFWIAGKIFRWYGLEL